MKAYQIIRREGLGLMECPTIDHPTNEVYLEKDTADKRADELWKLFTTEEQRKSGWCDLYFSVKEIEIK